MRAVVQRVSKASVTIGNIVKGEIGAGLCILLAIGEEDNFDTIRWMANKLVNLRIFNDEEGKMNKSVLDIGGGLLIISNFTLYGDAKKGFRPSFAHAARPEISEPLFGQLIDFMRKNYPIKIETGEFGAMMDVGLVNDGPVTVIVEK